jgi:hypothetical protein
MPASDSDIRRLALQFVQRHGDKAITKASEKVEEMRRKGYEEGVDMWLRIIVAIGDLGESQTKARH